jgi:hypothetical protein
MATNYTVVLFSRQHLGNEAGVFNDVEPNVVFVVNRLDLDLIPQRRVALRGAVRTLSRCDDDDGYPGSLPLPG